MRALLSGLMIVVCGLAGEAGATKATLTEGGELAGTPVYPVERSVRRYLSLKVYSIYVSDLMDTKQTARIRVSGATVVKGDTAVQVPPEGTRWDIVLKRTGDKTVRVWSSLRAETSNPRTYDLFERVLEVRFQRLDHEVDTVIVLDNYLVRAIAVRDGKRYRYGGMYRVAIDDDERESPRNYDRRAGVLSRADIRCADCGLKDTLTVPVVVTVGSKGRATWVRVLRRDGLAEPVPPTSVDPKVWLALEDGLGRLHYRSALSSGRPVADNVVFTARVVP